jgi:outer membrane lipoprotein
MSNSGTKHAQPASEPRLENTSFIRLRVALWWLRKGGDMRVSMVVVVLFALGSGALQGCAHEPISPSLRREAARGITVAEVQQNPDAYRGAVVIWGGRIVKVTVTGNGTDLYIARTPLNSEEWPRSAPYAEGRFIAHSNNLLEPSAYRVGRRVTVAGTITGTQQGQIGSAPYLYPVLDVDQLVLWRRPSSYYYPGAYWGGYGWPYWGLGWGWGDEDLFGGDFGDEDEGFDDEGEGENEGDEGDRDPPGR